MLEVLEIIPLRYSWLIPILNGLGIVLKHKTRIPNRFIPLLLFCFASIWSILLRASSLEYSGYLYWIDVLFLYGIINGLRCSLIACGGYEAVRNLTHSKVKGENMLKKKPFLLILIAFIVATVIFGTLSLCFGEDLWGIFTKLTDGWLFGVLFMLAFDITKRIAMDRDSITKTYIVMVVLIIFNVVSFFTASYATNLNWLIAGITGALVFGVSAGVLPVIVNHIKAKRDSNSSNSENEVDSASLQKEWAKIRAKLIGKSAKKQEEILNGFLAFTVNGDTIYGDLNLEAPLISNNGFAYSVNASIHNGQIAQDKIENAKNYIKTLIEKE